LQRAFPPASSGSDEIATLSTEQAGGVRELKSAIRDAGSVPLGEGFLTPEAVAEVAAEVGAMAAALDEVEAEQAAGAAN
jgi:hypothetical protein